MPMQRISKPPQKNEVPSSRSTVYGRYESCAFDILIIHYSVLFLLALDSGRLGRTNHKPESAHAIPQWGWSSDQMRYK